MATTFADITEELAGWIAEQHVFFVATAPAGPNGHINLSPKGGSDSFMVLGPHEVAYVDLFGSGIETVSHIKQNGRIVVAFCAFDGPPRILRLHGLAEVVEERDERFGALCDRFELSDKLSRAARSFVRIDVTRVSESCGFVVPRMAYEGDREQLFQTADSWVRKRGGDAVRDYCNANNRASIDDLPGLTPFEDGVAEQAHSHEGRKL